MNGYDQYKDCITACLNCAAMCNYCAASCTWEDDIKMMSSCIRLDMECAVICYAAAQLMSLGSDQATRICVLCADICEACGTECAQHNNEHCQECARYCKVCADECRRMNNR